MRTLQRDSEGNVRTLTYDRERNSFALADAPAQGKGPLRGVVYDKRTNTSRIGLLPAPGEKAKPLPCVSIEILAAEAVHELDPLLRTGDVFILPGIDKPTTIRDGQGVELFTLTPTEKEPTLDVPLEIYEAIVASAGIDPSDEVTLEWSAKGAGAMRALIEGIPQSHGLPGLRQCAEARLRMVESEGRWHLLPPSEIESVTGRPYEPRKALRKPGGKAFALALAKAGAEAEAKRLAEEERERDEAARAVNERTNEALNVTGISKPGDGFCTLPPGLQYVVPGHTPGMPAMLPVIPAIYTDRGATDYHLWKQIECMPLGSGKIAGCSILEPTDVVPFVPAGRLDNIADPPDAVYEFTRDVRRRLLPDVDRGPVREWTRAGEPKARAIAKKYAPCFGRQRDNLRRYLPGHAVALCVRALQVRPDRCVALFLAALDGKGVPDGVRDEIERLALAAAQAGEVSVGSMLPSSKENPKKGKG